MKEYCPECLKKGYQAEIFSAGSLYRCIRCSKDIEKRKVDPEPVKLGKKGKIMLCTIHGRTVMEGIDKQLFAVGKPKGKTYFRWWKWDPGLAPSRELVTFTKDYIRRKGHKEGWFERYTERLLDEWAIREDTMQSFVRLRKWLDSGLNVAIACYCAPEKRPQCHLSILGDVLTSMGYTVEEAEPIKYK
jgi:uncharacterized protein YeaO (DUF488 family)